MPAGPEQRRRTAASQSALLDAATERIVTHAVDALASQITPSVLARSTEIVSADTAYRMLESAEHTLQMLINRVSAPGFTSEELHWPVSSEMIATAVDAISTTHTVDGVRTAIGRLLRSGLELPAVALGRIVDAATMTASPAWEGDLHIRQDRLAIARQVRSARLGMIRAQDEEFELLLRIALTQLRRRPRSGVTVKQLVVVLRGLGEGMIERLLLDPEVGTVDDVVDAIIELAAALTEDGLLLGGSVPTDPVLQHRFESVLMLAEGHWRAGHTIDSLEMLAVEASIAPDELLALFPSVEDLADALLRSIVLSGEISGSRPTRLTLLSASLHRLAQVADELPLVVELDQSLDAEHSVLAQLKDVATELARTGLERSVGFDRFGEQLIASACAGAAHWQTTNVLIDLLRRGKSAI